jgi:hypothetical protein
VRLLSCLEKSYFKVKGNKWQQQSYYVSEDHLATEDVKFIRKIKFLKHHKKEKTSFWLDLVSGREDPPNVTKQSQPIENFWANFKGRSTATIIVQKM